MGRPTDRGGAVVEGEVHRPRHPRAVVVHGGRPLSGGVTVGGFKHALVPLVAASVLADEPVTIDNVPDIEETRVLGRILSRCGAAVRFDPGRRRLTVDASSIVDGTIDEELCARIHGPLYLLPVLLGRLGRAVLPRVGGCQIGNRRDNGQRPTAHVLDVLARFGARFETTERGIVGTCPGGLSAAEVDLSSYAVRAPGDGRPTGPHYSGATKAALLAAAAARGTSVLHDPYPKPDVTELVAALSAAGVPVTAGERRIVVHGTGGLPGGFSHLLVSDLIEVVTWIAAAVHLDAPLSLGGLTVERLRRGLDPELRALGQMGVGLHWTGDGLTVEPPRRPRAVDLVVASHSVYSDSQPFFALMLTGARRPSAITDTVWEDRFHYVDGLIRLGGRFEVEGSTLTVGPGRMRRPGQSIGAADLRSAAVCVLAALDVPGPTRIVGTHHLDRGYEQMFDGLRRAGARIEDGTGDDVG